MGMSKGAVLIMDYMIWTAVIAFTLSSFLSGVAMFLGIFWDPLLVPFMFAIMFGSIMLAEETAQLKVRDPDRRVMWIMIALSATLSLNYVFMPAIYSRLDTYMSSITGLGAAFAAVTSLGSYIPLLIGLILYAIALYAKKTGTQKMKGKGD
jgi:hypothetical protein